MPNILSILKTYKAMETLIEILVDNSNSMGPFEVEKNKGEYLLPDGSTRMSLAKSILIQEILPLFSQSSKVVIRKFHSITHKDSKTTPVIEPIYEGIFNLQNIINVINGIADPVNTGGTPITAAIKASIDSLSSYPNADRKIILITDGQETDGGNYKEAANAALKQYGIPCNILIVGIAQNESQEAIAKELATATKGSYVNLKAKNYTKDDLQSLLRPLKMDSINNTLINTVNNHPIGTEITITSNANAQTNNIPASKEPKIEEIEKTPDAHPKENNLEEQKKENAIEKKINDIAAWVEQNISAMNLIAQQLVNLSEEIKEIKKQQKDKDEDEREDIEIKENVDLNEKIRAASELFLFNKLIEKFGNRVKWLNKEGESFKDHDFEVIDSMEDSIEYYIECKGTLKNEKTFFMTKNEWMFFLENKKNYQIFLIINALDSPELIKIDNLMDWLIKGKVIPFAFKNIKLKAERMVFTIIGK